MGSNGMPGHSAAERQYHPSGRAGAVRTPGTPRKENKPHGRESSAVQDPGLKDYRLGECLGKGAFGSVYKAFNWGTGEAVAVKQIKLVDLPKSELRMIESEIDLLKNLKHDNIVKYIGFVKSADCLNIILEYCENGSLHSICKAYGKFPENLVGVYMTQVLQGLQYLHDQGVIHRDIKGANILTTKDGTVKLADFGVSTSTLAGGQDKEAQVVGTPYWMAPEIIQLSGASPASDIWSVGCTVIELLQGKPPYHNLAAMPALFAIVNDDHPPLPEGISAASRDFLMQCFQKDPNLRVTGRKLLRHAWIVGCRRSDAPVAKAQSNFNMAVDQVKQWNLALQSDGPSFRASTGSDSSGGLAPGLRGANHDGRHLNLATGPGRGALNLAKPRPISEAFRSPELADDDNWDNDFATAISPSALQLPHLKPQDNFGGLLSSDRLKAFASATESRMDGLAPHEEEFEGELLTIKGPAHLHDVNPHEQTIRPAPRKTESSKKQIQSKINSASATSARPTSPAKAHFGSKFELPSRPDLLYRESTEDYSDLVFDNDNVFDKGFGLGSRKGSRQSDSPQLFHPSDLTSLPRSMQAPSGSSTRRQKTASRPSVLPDRPMRRTRSSIEIQKFAEDDDEDFSDIFGPEDSVTDREESDKGSEDGAFMLMSKLSSNSWLGDDEDEHDPFASMDQEWDEVDLEANVARDRHARLCEKVEELVRSLKVQEGEEVLTDLAEEMLLLLCEHSEVKNLIISAHGLLPILEILEPCTVKSRQSMILQLLKVVNTIILDDVEIQENLCFVGGIPIITKFAARQYSSEIRLQAAAFVRQMYQTSTLTLQMFVSAGGLNVLVEFLDEDYDHTRDLVLIGVNGIWNVFELQGPTPKNDFCRIFSRSKILYPLALVLHRVLDEDDEDDEIHELIQGRIVNIFYLFSQAENYVKEVVADRQVLKSVLKDLRRMMPLHQVTMLKFIKNLSMLSTTLESLHSADAIDFLIDVLGHSVKKGQKHFREISNQVLNTLFNLCRLSKERQEDAAVGGIIPLLLKIMKTDRPPKEFALPILCDMAHSGSKGRRYLWQNGGLDFYVSLLADQYWQVTALDAILVWLQEETAKVETHLLECSFTNAMTSCFNTNRLNAFDSNLLEPLLKLLRLSPSLAATLSKPEMFAGIAQRLGHKKAVVRLNLLRLVRNIMDACEPSALAMGDGARMVNGTQVQSLMDVVRMLAEKDPAVLVRNLATELTRGHHLGGGQGLLLAADSTVSSAGSASASSAGSRRGSAPRRNTSYTPPSLHSSVSMPPTPTTSALHRPSYSSSSTASGAFIEVASSPRRAPAGHARTNSSIYRPRSRDGPTGIPRRVSGDASASASAAAVVGGGSSSSLASNGGPKGRLARNPAGLARRATGEVGGVALRSDSSMSNKENVGRAAAQGSEGRAGSAASLMGKRRFRGGSGDGRATQS